MKVNKEIYAKLLESSLADGKRKSISQSIFEKLNFTEASKETFEKANESFSGVDEKNQNNFKKVFLKKGREFQLKSGHKWIYSGAVEKYSDEFEPGEILRIFSFEKEFVGYGYFNKNCNFIAGRLLSRKDENPIFSIKNNIKNALELRKKLLDFEKTNCFRLINGEIDNIPGIIIDVYEKLFVFQVSTYGIERIKNEIVGILVEIFGKDIVIYEKSLNFSRKEEGLEDFEGFIYGEEIENVIVKENDIKFFIDIKSSQKTGLFLDQREMRKMIGDISKGKKVLNTFCYTGGFSLYSANNQAKKIVSIDISKKAIEIAKKNFEINNFSGDFEFLAEDVLYFIEKDDLDFDLIILDPPAFAKKKQDIERALNGYKKLNSKVFEKIKSGKFVLTCSCSYYVSEEAFFEIIKQSVIKSGRQIKLIKKHIQAIDHPLDFFHSEMNYLKSFLLYIE